MPVWAYILVGLGFLAGGAGLAVASVVAARQSSGEQIEALDHSKADASAPDSPQLSTGAETDDVTALARVLASEDETSPTARVIIGWITLEKARKQGVSVYQLATRGEGYGRQKRPGKPTYYASTAKAPSDVDYSLADGLVTGLIEPPARIREMGIGGWVEQGQLAKQLGRALSPEEDAARIIAFQWKWDEGIYGRVDKWFLFSRRAPKILQDYKDAFVLNGQIPDKPTPDDIAGILRPVALEALSHVPEVS